MLRRIVALPSLQELKLSGESGFNASQLQGMQRGLEQRKTPLSKFSLCLDDLRRTEQFIEGTLETVNVQSFEATQNFFEDISTGFWQRLKDSFASNRVIPTNVELRMHCPTTIMEGIALNSTLHTLDLNLNSWEESLGNLVSEVIGHHPTLKVLNLWFNDFRYRNWHLCLSSLPHSKLEELVVTGSGFIEEMSLEREDLMKVVDYACQNKTLKTLYLDWVESNRDILDCLPKFYQSGSQIESVGFGRGQDPYLTEKEYEELLNIARQNYNISQYQDLFLLNEKLPELDAICELNKSGRRYVLDQPNDREKGVDVLAGVSDNLDAIYFHLLENPNLCNIHGEDQGNHSVMTTKKKLPRPV